MQVSDRCWSLWTLRVSATSTAGLQKSLKLIHTATPDTTKLSCLCRVRFGGVNWIPDNTGLSPTENLKSEHVQSNRPVHTAAHQTRHRQDRLVASGVAVWIESARPPDKCVQRRSVSGGAGTAGATAGRTPTQNANFLLLLLWTMWVSVGIWLCKYNTPSMLIQNW